MENAKNNQELSNLIRGQKIEISQLKKQLKRVNESETLLRKAQNLAGIGFWQYNIESGGVVWSDKVYEIYGLDKRLPPPQLKDILNFSIPDERPHIASLIDEAISLGKGYKIDCNIVDHHGNHKTVHALGKPFFDDKGKCTHLFGVMADISEQKKKERMLHFLEFTVQSVSDGIFWIDENAKFYKVNATALSTLGYSNKELIGLSGKDINPTFTKEKSQAHWRKTKERGSLIFETTHKKKDGTIYPVEISNNIFEFEGKEFRCSLVRDISERKKREEQIEFALEEVKRLKNQLEQENIYLKEEIKLTHNFDWIITQSQAFKKVLHSIEQVAPSNATVLITGESGTGKELLARAIHSFSKRKKRPLVKVNCAALPANLIESELFGHEKGAFTGAFERKTGRFELANGGTIFLDEIGELPLPLQSKLLRVLQEKEFERLGNPKSIKTDIRVIAATNRNLEKEIKQGTFREDLFYRLNVFPIESIPLRDRKEDIPLLVQHFLQKNSLEMGKNLHTMPKKIMTELMSYHWPGNIRELENVMERAVILSNDGQLQYGNWLPKRNIDIGKTDFPTLEVHEKNHILEALKITRGKISGSAGAAKLLGINANTLYSRMKKLGIVGDKQFH